MNPNNPDMGNLGQNMGRNSQMQSLLLFIEMLLRTPFIPSWIKNWIIHCHQARGIEGLCTFRAKAKS